MNGILLVNKPKGITSHDVVAKLRRVFMTKAVGHAGTLDPMADGLLILLLGEATKLSNYIMGQDKKYSAEIQLGLESDSWDAEGELLTTKEDFDQKKIDFTEDQIKYAVTNLQGHLKFKVPVHSAIKVQGKKLYDYARKGQDVQVPTRVMKFYKSIYKASSFNNFYIDSKDFKTQVVNVDLECEKGSYIRSWVHHFGQNLGCGALMSGLTRHQSGAFLLKEAVDYNQLLDIEQIRMDIKKITTKHTPNKKLSIPQNSEELELKSLGDESEKSIVDRGLDLKDLNQNLHIKLKALTEKVIDLKSCIKGPFFRGFENEIRLLKNGQIPNDLNLRIRPLLKECQRNGDTILVRVFNSSLNHLVAILELAPTGRPKIIRAFQN